MATFVVKKLLWVYAHCTLTFTNKFCIFFGLQLARNEQFGRLLSKIVRSLFGIARSDVVMDSHVVDQLMRDLDWHTSYSDVG